MLFYKVEGIPVNIPENIDNSRNAIMEWAREISLKSEEFNRKSGSNNYYFVSDFHNRKLEVGIITEDNSKTVSDTTENFLRYIGCELKHSVSTEITMNSIDNLLRNSCRKGYISDDDEILEKYGLDKLVRHYSRGINFGENIIEDSCEKKIRKDSEKYLMKDSLIPELDRIYTGTSFRKPLGHPVHYILQTDSTDIRRETYKLLLQALYANKRLQSRRYCYLDFRPGDSFSMTAYNTLYKLCSGGAVVVRYLAGEDSEEEECASNERELIEKLGEVAANYRNKVLTVICLPREAKTVKDIFYENLGGMSFVEIREDFVGGEKAKNFLKMLAGDNHIRTDKALFEALEENKTYLAPDLQSIFNKWYNNKLKTKIYPQYKDVHAAQQKAVKTKHRGDAYTDLMEMIGLDSAKAVILKALNYYKIQKLCADRGLKKDNPAMHMVFSGNPGTAKTTVARLFTRIMKDNGLISKGQLVEVGRGDLVGKFVGWTAKTVQSKFKQAMGGVLFIDEAYSLVDDRNGSYGDEAINTIVQEMENHREDVVVIFAGYPDKMEEFLRKNPGLRSRIAFHVSFEDYTTEELCRIADLMGKHKGISFEDDALTRLGSVFEAARKQDDFGNGRYVRNILEQARMNQASRLLEQDIDSITAEEISTIRAVDISIPELKSEEKRMIGFGA